MRLTVLEQYAPLSGNLRVTPQAAGLRMAALTTLARLLEAKMVELEGDDGTGPLETDIAILQARRCWLWMTIKPLP